MKNKRIFWGAITLSSLLAPFAFVSCSCNKKEDKNLSQENKDKIRAIYDSKFDRSLASSKNEDALKALSEQGFELDKATVVSFNDKEGILTIKVNGKFQSKEFLEFELKFEGFRKIEVIEGQPELTEKLDGILDKKEKVESKADKSPLEFNSLKNSSEFLKDENQKATQAKEKVDKLVKEYNETNDPAKLAELKNAVIELDKENKEYEKKVMRVYDQILTILINPNDPNRYAAKWEDGNKLNEDLSKLSSKGWLALGMIAGFYSSLYGQAVDATVESITNAINNKSEEITSKLSEYNEHATIDSLEKLYFESTKFISDIILEHYDDFLKAVIEQYAKDLEASIEIPYVKKQIKKFVDKAKEDSNSETKNPNVILDLYNSLKELEQMSSWFINSLDIPRVNEDVININEVTPTEFIEQYKTNSNLLKFDPYDASVIWNHKFVEFKSEPYNVKLEKKNKNTIIVTYQVRCLNTIDSTNPNDFENQMISPEIQQEITNFKNEE